MAEAALELIQDDLTVENRSTKKQVLLIIPADDFRPEFVQAYAFKDSRMQKRVRVTAQGARQKEDGSVDEVEMFYEKKLPSKTCMHKVTVDMKASSTGRQIHIQAPVGDKKHRQKTHR